MFCVSAACGVVRLACEVQREVVGLWFMMKNELDSTLGLVTSNFLYLLSNTNKHYFEFALELFWFCLIVFGLGGRFSTSSDGVS